MTPTRIGVLGCAQIARRSVIPAIVSLADRYKLVAIASRSLCKAEEVGRRFHCEMAMGYEELVGSTEIDAIYIPLPTGLHREWINKALLAGKHVYAEKSIAYCHGDAQEMVANAEQNGLALMEGLMFQYHSQHKMVRDLLTRNTVGPIRHFFGAFGFPPLEPDNFRYDDQIGGGALLDAAAYPLRATHFILGDSLRVRGATLHFDAKRGTNTYGSAFLSNDEGLGASIAFGFDNFYQCRYEVWGAKGKLSVTRAFTPRAEHRPETIVETANGCQTIQASPDDHFVRALEEFDEMIRKKHVRQKHYADILLQSQSLEAIREFAAQNDSRATG